MLPERGNKPKRRGTKTNRGSQVSRPIKSSNRASNQISTGVFGAATSRASFRPTLPPLRPCLVWAGNWCLPPSTPLVSPSNWAALRSRARRGEVRSLVSVLRPAPAISCSPPGSNLPASSTSAQIYRPHHRRTFHLGPHFFNDGSPETRQSLTSLVCECSLVSELTFPCFPYRSAAAADALHSTRLSVRNPGHLRSPAEV